MEDNNVSKTSLYNHPLVPILVYEFYVSIIKEKTYFGREQPINRNQWSWLTIECKKYVAKCLGVSGPDADIILFESNTIEPTLFVLFTMDRRTFVDGAVPDIFVDRSDN